MKIIPLRLVNTNQAKPLNKFRNHHWQYFVCIQ